MAPQFARRGLLITMATPSWRAARGWWGELCVTPQCHCPPSGTNILDGIGLSIVQCTVRRGSSSPQAFASGLEESPLSARGFSCVGTGGARDMVAC